MTTQALSRPAQDYAPPKFDQKWIDGALCPQVDPEVFFPNTTGRKLSHAKAYDTARSICHQCPVMQQCRADVMEYERGTSVYQRFGMFGGLTPAERSDLDLLQSSGQEANAGHSHSATQSSPDRMTTIQDAGHS
jgi:WhiB family redox-sensing transcriptional regulator